MTTQSEVKDAAAPAPVAGNAPAAIQYVYAIGRIEPRFPSLAVEKEFMQVAGRSGTAGLTDRQAARSVLSERANRYLARQMCWVFSIEGLETYLLISRDPADLELFIEALRPSPSPMDIDVIVGVRGPIARPEVCNGLMLPIVAVDQIYSFDRTALIQALPRPNGVAKDRDHQFRAAAGELFDRIMQVADNSGAADEHRALNYLAVRYDSIYARAAEAHVANMALTGVTVRPSRLNGARRVLDVVFSYTHRATDVTEQVFVRVDVTEEFPFMVSKLAPYFER